MITISLIQFLENRVKESNTDDNGQNDEGRNGEPTVCSAVDQGDSVAGEDRARGGIAVIQPERDQDKVCEKEQETVWQEQEPRTGLVYKWIKNSFR